ncbi:unnamed protein product, partial [Prorocentrum cordatum]
PFWLTFLRNQFVLQHQAYPCYSLLALVHSLLMSSSGQIKKFFTDKGFGFITPDDGSEDVFVHVKDNGGDDAFANVQAGDAVRYDAEYDDRKGKYLVDFGHPIPCPRQGSG